MPYGQLAFWFITYTAIIAGTAVSANTLANSGERRFRSILYMDISLLVMVLAVSLMIFTYHQSDLKIGSSYYLFLQILFFLGIAATSYFLLRIPSVVFPKKSKKCPPPPLTALILVGFSAYLVSLAVEEIFHPGHSLAVLICGIFQLLLFFNFIVDSLYVFASLLRFWRIESPLVKMILFAFGLVAILSVFLVDIVYGLWSKMHFHREISVFYILPAYALLVSTILTVFVLKKTAEKPILPEKINPSVLESYGISPREEEVIRLLIIGAGYKEIGERLHISLATVQSHIRNIYRKTDVNNKVELINLLQKDL